MKKPKIICPVAKRLAIHILKNGRSAWSDKRRYEAWDSIEIY